MAAGKHIVAFRREGDDFNAVDADIDGDQVENRLLDRVAALRLVIDGAVHARIAGPSGDSGGREGEGEKSSDGLGEMHF